MYERRLGVYRLNRNSRPGAPSVFVFDENTYESKIRLLHQVWAGLLRRSTWRAVIFSSTAIKTLNPWMRGL